MFRKSLPIIFAIAAVAIMVAPAVNVGYATSYTAATASIGNQITTDYFTVGIFSNSGCTSFAQNLLSDNIEYNVGPDNLKTLHTTAVSYSPLYFKIDGTNHTKSSESATYSVQASWSCRFNSTTVNGATLTLSFGDDHDIVVTGGGSTTINLQAGVYPFSFSIENASATLVSDSISLGVTITIVATEIVNGTTIGSDTVAMTAIGNVPITTPEEAEEAMSDANSGQGSSIGDDPDQYSFEEATTFNTGSHTVYAIEVTSNSGTGIADASGAVQLTLNIPAGSYFAIRCKGAIKSEADLRFDITVDGVSKWCKITQNYNNWTKYIFNYYKTSLSPQQFIQGASDYNTRVDDKSYWMSGNTAELSLRNVEGTITSDVTMEIILWPTDS